MDNKEFFNALLNAQGKLGVIENAEGIRLCVRCASIQDLADALVGPGKMAVLHVTQPKDENNNVIVEVTRCYETTDRHPYVYDNTEVWVCAIPKEDVVNRFSACFSLSFDD